MTDIKKYMDVVKDMRFRETVNARLKLREKLYPKT